MFHYGFILKEEINIFLNSLAVIGGEIIITSLKVSEWFVDVYYKEDYDIFHKSKVRVVDPLILIEDQICKTSEISGVVKTLNEKALIKSEEGMFLKII
ncbi:MAG: hypothetical protein ACRC68_18660 [Clostridium sp.]